MKKYLFIILFVLFNSIGYSQNTSIPPNGDNEKAEVSQWIGPVKVTITYHSPDVHAPDGTDRKGHIWGGLVGFGFFDMGLGPSTAIPWRAGANETTTISVSHDVSINGKTLKEGTYALFLDVEKTGPSNWIISSQTGWGSFQYDSKFDVMRIPTTGEEAPYTEWLTFGFDDRKPSSTVAFLQWENKRFPFKIEVPNVNMLYVEQWRKDLLGWAGFTPQNWYTAAVFCMTSRINLDEALVWINKALYGAFRGVVPGKKEFLFYQTKAGILGAMGKVKEAQMVMDSAVHLPGAEAKYIHYFVQRLIKQGNTQRALSVAQYTMQSHPDEKYWTYLSLATVYTALHDNAAAIRNWEIAIANITDDDADSLPMYREELKKLQDSK